MSHVSSPLGSSVPESPAGRWIETQLAALPFSMALLDEHGQILAVNQVWRRFALENGADAALIEGVGLNYLAVCDRADVPEAAAVAAAVRAVLAGERQDFELEYACHSLRRLRWFRVRVSSGVGPRMVTLAHLDTTEAHMLRARLAIQSTVAHTFGARMPLVTACREVGLAVAEELGADFVGVWTLEPSSWTMRCADTWTRTAGTATVVSGSRAAALGPGRGLPGRAWKQAKVQWVTVRDRDATRASEVGADFLIIPPSSVAAGIRTALAFPLRLADDVLAVVEVLSRIEHEPDESLIELLETAGEQLGLSELRQRAERYAELAMQEAEDARAQLEAVLSCAPSFIVMIDAEEHIQFINRTLPPLGREHLVNTHWRSVLPPSTHAQVGAALRAVFALGETRHYELCVPWEGRTLWMTCEMGPMRTSAGIIGAVIIAQDVTSVKRDQEELANAQRLASVGTLAAGVAHEINTPVQFVNDSIHFLRETSRDLFALLEQLLRVVDAVRDGAAPDQLTAAAAAAQEVLLEADLPYLQEHVPKAHERAIDGLERVTAIVRSMKEFSHPSGEHKSAVDLNRAVAATLTVARNEYKYVADLETDFGELPPVICHVNEINQAVLNIVINAAHAIAEKVAGSATKGRIRVCTRRDQDHVRISISDTGGGIPEEVRRHIFDPFFTTKEVGRGTGQGLPIARSAICDKHHGELSFETTVGEGTTFHIRLPISGEKT